MSAPPPSLLNFYKTKTPVKKPVSVLVNNSVLRNVTNPQLMPIITNNAITRNKKRIVSLSAYKSAMPKKVTMAKRGGKKSKKSKTRKSRK
jgi:hypothetical protein